MFSSMNSEHGEGKIKQRLVGALVLIALAVIIVPLILDFRKDYGTVIKGTNIPPKPDDFRVEVVPIQPPESTGTPSADKDISGIISEMPGDEDGAETQPKDTSAPSVKPEVRSIETGTASSPSPAVTKKPDQTAAGPAGQGWVVQLGSFSSKPNAEDLRDQLQKKGYKAFVDEIRVDNNQIQRVRIGPFDKKTQAEAIRDKLITEMKLNAIVVSDR